MEEERFEPEFNVAYNDTWSLCVAFGVSGLGGEMWYQSMRVRLYCGHHYEEAQATVNGLTIAIVRERLEPAVRNIFFTLENRMQRCLYVKYPPDVYDKMLYPKLPYFKSKVRAALVRFFWVDPELSTNLPKDCRIYCDPAIFFI